MFKLYKEFLRLMKDTVDRNGLGFLKERAFVVIHKIFGIFTTISLQFEEEKKDLSTIHSEFYPQYLKFKSELLPVKIPKIRRGKGRPKKEETEVLLSKISSSKFNPFLEERLKMEAEMAQRMRDNPAPLLKKRRKTRKPYTGKPRGRPKKKKRIHWRVRLKMKLEEERLKKEAEEAGLRVE